MSSAKDICAMQTGDEAWAYIRVHSDAFFWSDDESHVETWSRNYGLASGGHLISEEWRDESLWLFYREKTVQVPLRFDRVDRWIIIHTMANLVKPDYEVRFCKDSAHSSNQAFLALTAVEWQECESAFDSEMVARRFLSLDVDFDIFFDKAFPAAAIPTGRLDASLKNWAGGLSYQPAKLDYAIVYEGGDRVLRGKLESLFGRYLEPGKVGVSTDTILDVYWVDRDSLSDIVAPLIGSHTVRVVDSTQKGFFIVERVGVAAGWRTDGREFLDVGYPIKYRRWWEFWRPR